MENNQNTSKVPFEDALDKAGFGLYSYTLIALTGFIILSMVCMCYSSTIIAPTSACELATTSSQQGLIVAGPVVGAILGGVLWGYLSDRKGRRNVLIISLLSGGSMSALASLSVNWVMLLVLQCLTALLSSGQLSLAMTLLSESVPRAHRNVVVVVVTSIFLLSQGAMAVIAIPIMPLSFSYYISSLGIYWNSWRTVLLVYSVLPFIIALWLYFMQESPKFAFNKRQDDRALKILREIYRINNRGSAEELQIKSFLHDASQNEHPSKTKVLLLFRPPLVKYTIIITALYVCQQVGSLQVWLPRIADQFVRQVQSHEGANMTLCRTIHASLHAPVQIKATPCALNVNALLIVLCVGVMESSTNIFIAMIVNRAGRRNTVMAVTAFCGICGILINLIPNAVGSAVMFGFFLIGILVYGLYTAITVALFPTNLRALAVALTMTGGRISNIAAIQILNYLLVNNCEVGFYAAAAVFGFSCVIASFLPDDRFLRPDFTTNYEELCTLDTNRINSLESMKFKYDMYKE